MRRLNQALDLSKFHCFLGTTVAVQCTFFKVVVDDSLGTLRYKDGKARTGTWTKQTFAGPRRCVAKNNDALFSQRTASQKFDLR